MFIFSKEGAKCPLSEVSFVLRFYFTLCMYIGLGKEHSTILNGTSADCNNFERHVVDIIIFYRHI